MVSIIVTNANRIGAVLTSFKISAPAAIAAKNTNAITSPIVSPPSSFEVVLGNSVAGTTDNTVMKIYRRREKSNDEALLFNMITSASDNATTARAKVSEAAMPRGAALLSWRLDSAGVCA